MCVCAYVCSKIERDCAQDHIKQEKQVHSMV